MQLPNKKTRNQRIRTESRISEVSIAELKPDPLNPRVHDPSQIRKLAKSIQTFGFISVIVVDKRNQIICGHARLEAAKLAGLTHVPVLRADHLSDAQLKGLMIAENRLAELASWNETLLAEHFKVLSELDINFDPETTGFEIGEIDLLIGGLSPVIGASDPADELPQVEEIGVTTDGDLWQLGDNKVFCGNCLHASAWQAIMQDRRANMIFTDPPYNVKIEGHASGLGAVRHKNFRMASGEMSEEQFTEFLTIAFDQLRSHSADSSLHFITMDWRHMHEVLTAGRTVYTELKNLCVWVKNSGGMGSLYRSQHELVFVFKNGAEAHRNNVQLGAFGRNRTNVWNYAGANSFARHSEEGNLLAIHPTVKPVALIADAIMDCTNRGDLIVDAFLGSGSTVIAAERTGRVCHGIEIDPAYVDAAVRRWERFTGLEAVHSKSGRTFKQLEDQKR